MNNKHRNIGGFLVAIGVVLFLTGWFMGARGVNIAWQDGRLQFVAAMESSDIPIHEFISDIQITSISANIEIIGHTGNETSVNLIGVSADFDINNNTLVIRENNRMVFSIINIVSPIIRVNLPNNQIYRLDAQVSIGRITTSDLTLETANLRASTGGIRLNNIVSDTVNLHSSSGTIRLNEVILHDIFINNSSGGIRINNVAVNSVLNAVTSSGRITGERIQMASQSNMNVQASSGSVNISLLNRDIVYNLYSRSGSQRVNGTRYNGISTITDSNTPIVNIRTSSGSIRLNTAQ